MDYYPGSTIIQLKTARQSLLTLKNCVVLTPEQQKTVWEIEGRVEATLRARKDSRPKGGESMTQPR